MSESKTKVVCSSRAMTDSVQAALKDRGLRIAVVESARDLGVDTSAGKHRRVRVAAGRIVACGKRVGRIRRLARVRRKARSLYMAASAQATWGQEVLGLSGSALREVRRQALRACGFRAGGLCGPTALMSLFGVRGDPAVRTLCHVVGCLEDSKAAPDGDVSLLGNLT